MEGGYIPRKVQRIKAGSFIVTIPIRIIRELGLDKDPHVWFFTTGKAIIVKPAGSKPTKKEEVESGRVGNPETGGSGSSGESERPAYEAELDAALNRKKDNRSRLEKLKMK